jgi:hypothetical protein
VVGEEEGEEGGDGDGEGGVMIGGIRGLGVWAEWKVEGMRSGVGVVSELCRSCVAAESGVRSGDGGLTEIFLDWTFDAFMRNFYGA